MQRHIASADTDSVVPRAYTRHPLPTDEHNTTRIIRHHSCERPLKEQCDETNSSRVQRHPLSGPARPALVRQPGGNAATDACRSPKRGLTLVESRRLCRWIGVRHVPLNRKAVRNPQLKETENAEVTDRGSGCEHDGVYRGAGAERSSQSRRDV
jgi:hypothetical protein